MAEYLGISDAFFWLIVIIILAVTEIATARLVAVWIAVGALCALLAAVFNLSLPLQALIFVITSAAALAITRPFVKRIIAKDVYKSSQTLIGQVVFVTECVDNDKGTGFVKVMGRKIKARSEKGDIIETGTQAVVSRTDGFTVYIVKM